MVFSASAHYVTTLCDKCMVTSSEQECVMCWGAPRYSALPLCTRFLPYVSQIILHVHACVQINTVDTSTVYCNSVTSFLPLDLQAQLMHACKM